jgi:GNAT superfamily N-acetyltransferase
MIYRPAIASDVLLIHASITQMVDGTAFAPPTLEKVARIVAGYHTECVFDGDKLARFMASQLSETFLNDEVNAYEKGLYVAPEYRGGTIAVRLIRNFEAWASKNGAANIWLGQSVGQNQEQTLHFFQRLGYVCQGFTTCKKL